MRQSHLNRPSRLIQMYHGGYPSLLTVATFAQLARAHRGLPWERGWGIVARHARPPLRRLRRTRFAACVTALVLGSGLVTAPLSTAAPTDTAVADSYVVASARTLDVAAPGVLGNDTVVTPNGRARLESDVSHGSLDLSNDGSISYAPDSDFFGDDTFTYCIGNADVCFSNVATVTISVKQANADFYTMPSVDSSVGLLIDAPGPLGNDDNVGSGTAVKTSDPAHGSVSVAPDGRTVYFKDAGFAGADTFTYCISVAGSCVSSATVEIDVLPFAESDFYNSFSGDLTVAAPGVLGNDAFESGDTAAIVDDPENGAVTLNKDGSFHYTADADFTGTDTFTYCVDADGCASNTTTVSIRVGPQAFEDSYNVPGDSLTVSAADGVLSNDVVGPGQQVGLVTDSGPFEGSLVFNADGSFTYTPDPGFAGFDSFRYCFLNSDHNCTDVGAQVDIFVSSIAADDSYTVPRAGLSVDEADGVLANDRTRGEIPVVPDDASEPKHGTLTLNHDGSFDYVPDSTFAGTDTFTYCLASEGCGDSATVTLHVLPGAVDDSYTASSTGIHVAAPGVLGNDVIGTGMVAKLKTAPAHGTVVLKPDGSFTYTPDGASPAFGGRATPDASTPDSFRYCIAQNGTCLIAPATVRLTVQQGPTPPPSTTPPTTSPTPPPPTTTPPTTPATAPPAVPPVTTPTTTPDAPTTPVPTPPTTVPTTNPAGPHTVHLRLRTVGIGSTNVASGEGCAPGATVTLSVEGRTVATTTADGNGRFQARFSVPELTIGGHTLVASCGQIANAAFDVVQSSQVDPGTTTMLVLIIFILLGLGLLRGQIGAVKNRGRHG